MSLGEFRASWSNYSTFSLNQYYDWYKKGTFTDVTIHVAGQSLRAHKLMLAASSPFFEGVFRDPQRQHNNANLYFEDVPFESMKGVIEYMYTGQLDVEQEFMKVCLLIADSLQVRGLRMMLDDEPITEPKQVSAEMHAYIESLLSPQPAQHKDIPEAVSTTTEVEVEMEQQLNITVNTLQSSVPTLEPQREQLDMNIAQQSYTNQPNCSSSTSQPKNLALPTKRVNKAPIVTNETFRIPKKKRREYHKKNDNSKPISYAKQKNVETLVTQSCEKVEYKPFERRVQAVASTTSASVPKSNSMPHSTVRSTGITQVEPQKTTANENLVTSTANWMSTVHHNNRNGKRSTIFPPPIEFIKDHKKQFRCQLCNREFGFKSNYYRHYSGIHQPNELPGFACPHCARKFTRKDNMTDHAKRMHFI